MRTERKKPEADLRHYYTIFLQAGLIVTMLACLAAVKVNLATKQVNVDMVEEQEIVEMEEIIQTKQIEKPPPPPRPPVPVEVPNDEIIEDEILDLDAELDLDAPIDLPPPPPPAEEEDEDEVFIIVERMPELKGGLAGLQKNITYPKMAQKAGIEGRVYVQFIVDENGNVQNPRVTRGIGAGCDEVALNAVRKAKFTPGFQRGKPVRVQYSLPVIFKLSN